MRTIVQMRKLRLRGEMDFPPTCLREHEGREVGIAAPVRRWRQEAGGEVGWLGLWLGLVPLGTLSFRAECL